MIATVHRGRVNNAVSDDMVIIDIIWIHPGRLIAILKLFYEHHRNKTS
jgi:hypothetical protein